MRKHPFWSLLIFFTLIFSIRLTSHAQEMEYQSFDEVQTQINKLETAKDYAGAIEFIDSVKNNFPENEFEVILEKAYCNLKLKNYDKSMDLWEEGHSKGYFFLLRTRNPNYADIRESERFKNICDKDDELRKEVIGKSKTIYEVKLPKDYSEDKSYPMFFILHGGGRDLNSPKEFWISKTLNDNFIVVYLQSYLYYTSRSYGWANHDLRAEEDIKNIFDEIISQYKVDTKNVWMGGISAGGSAAFDIGLINPVIPLKGIIAICPAIEGKDFTTGQVAELKEKNIDLNIITGENDWGLERQKQVMQMLDDAGVNYTVTIIPGMGHEYPPDFPTRLENILSELQF